MYLSRRSVVLQGWGDVRPVLLLLGVLATAAPPCAAFRALLFPCNIQSHYLYFGRLGLALQREGHHISLLVADNARLPDWLQDGSMKIYRYSSMGDVPFVNTKQASKLFVDVATATSIMEKVAVYKIFVPTLLEHFRYECTGVLTNQKLLQELRDAQFDISVMDLGCMICHYTVPYKLDLPHVTLSTDTTGWMYRVPSLPSFTPSLLSDDLSDDMNFWSRLKNFGLHMAGYLFLNSTSHYTETYVTDKPPLTSIELFQQTKLWFILGDGVINYPRASMPNTVDIGDIILDEPGILSPEWQSFMDDSPDGVILLSFGSLVDHLPEEPIRKMCRAFQQIKQRVIWKSKSNPNLCQEEGLGDRIKVTNWMPQNALLAHPNVRLFMTHCGTNSVLEAIYHATPMIGMPIMLDQPFNANSVQGKGYGVKINLFDFNVDELVNAIRDVTTNVTIKENIRRASGILRDKPESAGRRAAYWIKHVLDHGDDHLRTKAFNLNTLQFFMIDIVLFLCFVALVLLVVLFLMCWCCYRCTVRCCKKSAVIKDKTE